MKLTPEAVMAAVAEHGSIRKAAKALGKDDRTLRRILKRAQGDAPADAGRVTVERKGDTVELTAPSASAGKVDELIRENGLDPAEWVIVSTTLNRWDGPVAGGGTQPLRQVKVTLRRKPEHVFPRPVEVAPLDFPRVERPVWRRSGPELWIVEYDHQAPYHDPRLDAAATAMHADLQPDGQLFGGDLGDYPTASRHADHPAANASVQTSLDESHGILRRRREAAPDARAVLLKGNHDWRLESYLLDHASRFYGITPAGSDVPAMSMRNLLQLDALGVELIEDPRGWQHGEFVIVPGERGLVARHGWITGANTAGRSLHKRGRSMLVGHGHGREHAFQWDPSAEVERQAVMVATMSHARDAVFPHFATCDDWLQGCATVSVWPDGRFVIEHARWDGQALLWRDRRWEA